MISLKIGIVLYDFPENWHRVVYVKMISLKNCIVLSMSK